MPLDVEARAILDMLAKEGWDRLPVMSPIQARALMERLPPLSAMPAEAVARVENFVMRTGDTQLRARIYYPHVDTPAPALLYFHGGGFVLGGLGSGDGFCRALSNRTQCAIISVDYRLAPENPYPAAITDAYAAADWVIRHGLDLQVDSRTILVGGNSAGGNLATTVARRARDHGGPPIAAQMLLFPLVDLNFDQPSIESNGHDYLLTKQELLWYRSHYLLEASLAREPDASPLLAEDLAGMPPAIVVVAEFDPLVDQGRAYAERLATAGVRVRLLAYKGLMHSFLTMSTASGRGRRGLDEVAAELRSILRGGETGSE